LLHGATSAITVKSELKNGVLMSLEECIALKPFFESWSQIVLDTLIKKYALPTE
jgi:hypothetical protein